MKKIVTSVGLVAVGASGLQAVNISGITDDSPTKPWNASVSLRGFYDDNINTSSDGSKDMLGMEVSPSIGFAMSWPQTKVAIGYTYSFKWYERKPQGNSENYDQTHEVNAALDHAFSERYKASLSDSLAIGQEPDVLRAGNTFATFQRISGYNLRNYGSAALTAQMTPLVALRPAYNNAYYNYAQNGGNADNPSTAGVLNRIENAPSLDTLWTVTPTTFGVVGAQFREVDYTAGEEIGITGNGETVTSGDKNFREYYVYVGADTTFRPDLTASVRVGGQYVDYFNDPNGQNGWGPYAQASMRYIYQPKCYVEVGLTQDLNATDVTGVDNNSFTTSAESTSVYGSINHQITPKLRGSLLGQFQNSVFQGGLYDGETEQYFLAGLNFKYQFTPHFAGETGYNFDRLISDVPNRTYSRNRVYIGVSASY